MTSMPPFYTWLMEHASEEAREFLKNVQPVTVVRGPEELPAAAGDDLCWIWQGSATREGYAEVDRVYVHRRAYELFVGPIPHNMRVERECDNRLCVNPRHLRVATRSQIAIRAASTNRVKLTPEQIEGIKNAIMDGTPQSEVAQRFGISQAHVSLIKNRKIWKGNEDVPFMPVDGADEHAALSLIDWLNLQTRRLGPIGQLARGETMSDTAREKALSKATKEFLTYQLLSREYEARRKSTSR